MAKQLIKGEKVVLCKTDDVLCNFTLELKYSVALDCIFDVDLWMFHQDELSRIDKKDIIYYNNSTSRYGGVEYKENYDKKIKVLDVNLKVTPKNFSKLILGCSFYNTYNKVFNKSVLADITFTIYDKTTNLAMYVYPMQIDINSNESLVVGDIYRHKDLWKLSAVGHSANINLIGIIKSLYNISMY